MVVEMVVPVVILTTGVPVVAPVDMLVMAATGRQGMSYIMDKTVLVVQVVVEVLLLVHIVVVPVEA
jgi:hypothetical protein